MGDAADDYTGQGFDQLAAHRRGECEGPCPYCDDGDDGPMAYECDVCGRVDCDGEECVEDEPQGGYTRDDDD
jgi:hypothetical protein